MSTAPSAALPDRSVPPADVGIAKADGLDQTRLVSSASKGPEPPAARVSWSGRKTKGESQPRCPLCGHELDEPLAHIGGDGPDAG